MRCCIEYMPQHVSSIWPRAVSKYARYKPQFDLLSGTSSLALTRTISGIGKTYTMQCSFTNAIRKIMPIRIRLYSVRLSSHMYVITTNARIYRCRHAPLIKLTSPCSAIAALSEYTHKRSLSLKTLVVVLGE